MSVRGRLAYVIGFLLIMGGVVLLSFSQISPVAPSPERTELAELREGGLISEVGSVVVSAFMVTAGSVVVLNRASRAPAVPKWIALGSISIALPVFFVAQTLLVINAVAADFGTYRAVRFSASYFFHTGDDMSFAAVYILFFFLLMLLYVLIGATAYLLAPKRFPRAMLSRLNWAKNESVHVAATLFLLSSLSVLTYYVFRLAAGTHGSDLRGQGALAELLLPVYYLLGILLFLLILVVAGHAFLVSWGTQGPVSIPRLVENIRTIRRVERGMLAAAASLNLFILVAPQLPTSLALSTTTVFGVSARGLSLAFFVLLVPYIPYAYTQGRLDFLVRAGKAPNTSALFAERSLRMVIVHMLGLAFIVTLAALASWQALALMLALAAWTAGVMLVNAVRVEVGPGLPRLAFNGDAGVPLYFVFLGLALSVGIMLWGVGNTFEVQYVSNTNTLQFLNENSLGEDVFSRIAAASIVFGALILSLDLWLHAYRVPRQFLGHYLGLFISGTLVTLLVFSVGVWTAGDGRGLEDAYAGFAFRQYYAFEEFGVAALLIGAGIYAYAALSQMLAPLVSRQDTTVPPVRTVRIRMR